MDIDYACDVDHRVVQFTPPGSETSIHIGKGFTSAAPGSLRNVYLVVSDIEKARTDLEGRGITVSEVFHHDGLLGPVATGPDPKRGTYASFASFEDPDANGWLVQEITTRLPGREWKSTATDLASVAELLREAKQYHGNYEKMHGQHHWWAWYAPYLTARQNGCNPEEAIAAADRRMDEVLHILPR